MTRYESAGIFIGFKIQLKNLIDQINEDNFCVVKKLLSEGFIEDSNGNLNEYFKNVIEDENIPSEYFDYKKFIIDKFNQNFGDKNLNKQFLLIPVIKMLETTRWGLNRKGTNCNSLNLDFDFEQIKQKIQDEYEHLLNDYRVVMILNQEAD